MGRILEPIIIQDFSKGMTNDLRINDTRYAKLIRNFDAHSFKNRLVPFRNMKLGDASANANSIQNFQIALRTGTTYSLYGLGRISATDVGVKIFYKDLTYSGANDLNDSDWAAASAGEGTSAASIDYNLFIYYRRAALIIGARDGTNLWGFSPTGSAFSNSLDSLTYTHIGQGLVHSANDVLYIPYYNNAGAANAKSFIASKVGTAAITAATLTLPDHLIPASICEYGNYLAIGCYPASGLGKSYVFLWDRNSTSWNEVIEWGEGNLFVLEEIEGYLTGVSCIGAGVIGGVALNSNIKITFAPKILIKISTGGKPDTIREFIANSVAAGTNLSVRLSKQKANNYLYFFLAMSFPDGNLREGIWKVGKNKQTREWSVVLDRGQNNDTDTTSGTLRGFIVVGDFVFVGYLDTTHALNKTDDAANYTATSIYETIILNFGDSSKTKKLLSVTVMHEPLASGASVLARYKIDDTIDDNSTFTTILTSDTDNDIRATAINIESSGANLPQFKEIVLRIESTGNGIITGLKVRAEEINDDLIN